MGFLSVIPVILVVTVTCTVVAGQVEPISYRVTLSIFSGVPDPVWVIHGNLTVELPTHNTTLASVLGYSGFIIEKFQGTQKLGMWTVGRCSKPSLETSLLNEVKGRVPQQYQQYQHTLPESLILAVKQTINSCPNQN